MRLAELVATSAAVAGTPSRLAKVSALSALLRGAGDEVGLAARYLAGQVRQVRTDVGWRLVADVRVEPAAVPSLTLAAVDDALQRLADAGGTGSRTVRRDVLAGLLGAATAQEQEFLRALVLGEVRQGALAGVAAQAIAAAAGADQADVRRALMLRADLGVVAEAALRGDLSSLGLALFQPLQPMLASTAPSVGAVLADLPCAAIEWKLDGTRIQVHRRGEEVRCYSRLLRDVTGRSAAAVEVVGALPCETAILDGELLAVGADGRPVAFQDTMRSRSGSAGPQAPQPFFFDLLHLDGRDLLDEPLSVRAAALDGLVGERNRVPHAVVHDVGGAEAVYDEALDRGHEGVVVKALDAPYTAGRRGSAWRKVKPIRTLDLVVLAVEEGSGRRRGWLSNLHLGARDGDGFAMLGKTFKGMTDDLLAWQTERLLALETSRDGTVVHVRPQLVVEIALDGVQRSTRYASGMALRFARVVRYREDKTPAEADDVAAVRALLGPPEGGAV